VDSVLAIAFQVMAVSASGALSPGPLTVATMALGTRGGWKAGVFVSFGHALFELPYLVILVLAFNALVSFLGVAAQLLAVAGALAILYFAYLLFRDAYRGVNINAVGVGTATNPLALGFTFTALNPYFLLWWLSIGMALVAQVQSLGLASLVIIYPAHVWLDFAWLTLVAELSGRGSRVLSPRSQRVLLALLATILIIFATNTITKSTLNTSILP
jgi:threonine/homoserine/homoserine lactone efflux protein